jgi:hypothetical protein
MRNLGKRLRLPAMIVAFGHDRFVSGGTNLVRQVLISEHHIGSLPVARSRGCIERWFVVPVQLIVVSNQ